MGLCEDLGINNPLKCEICGKQSDEDKGFIYNFTYHAFCSDDCRTMYRKAIKEIENRE